MSRVPAGERVRRVLALVPWISERSPADIDEVCTRFGVSRAELLTDLGVLSFVGVAPHTPDTLIEVDVDDDRISIRLTEPFHRPLRLTPPQALALIAAGRSVRAVPGADPGDALQRALTKLAASIGVDPEQVEVDLGGPPPQVLEMVLDAARRSRSLEIEYYSLHSEELSTRRVDPHRVFADAGAWYLAGWCHRSRDQRVFRLDRIRQARLTEEEFEPPPGDPGWRRYQPRDDDPRVRIEVDRARRWILEQQVCEEMLELASGRMQVRLAVSSRGWLERLLLTCGPDAVLLEAPPELASCGAEAAARILELYGGVARP